MPCRLHFLQKKLKILFYSTTKNQLIFIIISRKVKQHQLLTVFIFYNDLWKTPQARLAILLLFMWLNLVKSIKLPTYPEEGSSHYVVQKFSFSFLKFFFLARDWTQQKDTKLPTYPRKGSSHHVVQKFSSFFFFLKNFFWRVTELSKKILSCLRTLERD